MLSLFAPATVFANKLSALETIIVRNLFKLFFSFPSLNSNGIQKKSISPFLNKDPLLLCPDNEERNYVCAWREIRAMVPLFPMVLRV